MRKALAVWCWVTLEAELGFPVLEQNVDQKISLLAQLTIASGMAGDHGQGTKFCSNQSNSFAFFKMYLEEFPSQLILDLKC